MTDNTKTTRRPRRLRSAAPLVLSALALFAATTGVATALPGTDTVNSGDIKNERVKSEDLKDGSITKDDLGASSIDSEAIGDGIHTHESTTVVGGGAAENGNYNTGTVTASCGAGEELISGSARWQDDAASEELFVSEVTLNHGAETVTVKGGNDSGNNRTLVASAHCL
jgi:hypothetical protein